MKTHMSWLVSILAGMARLLLELAIAIEPLQARAELSAPEHLEVRFLGPLPYFALNPVGIEQQLTLRCSPVRVSGQAYLSTSESGFGNSPHRP